MCDVCMLQMRGIGMELGLARLRLVFILEPPV
jgi:hypothetical protein